MFMKDELCNLSLVIQRYWLHWKKTEDKKPEFDSWFIFFNPPYSLLKWIALLTVSVLDYTYTNTWLYELYVTLVLTVDSSSTYYSVLDKQLPV